MFNFDKFDIQRIAVSSVGALALSAACVLGAAGPARAANPAVSVADWQGAVERQIDSGTDSYASRMDGKKPVDAVLALRFTADGDYAGASVARSSGSASLDAHAVNLAGHVRYPALPAAYRGQPQTVAMRLVFGMAHDAAEAKAMLAPKSAGTVQIAAADHGGGKSIAAK